jgi:probable rRNA maturation factor
VWLTTNDEIASLNARYRGLYAPTDVLSFPAGTIPAPIPELPLGDVVVSVEQAAQQAKLNGHDFVTELLMLCLHGTLHLLGYDDQTDAQRAHMNQIAVRTLRALGYPAKEEWSSRHYEG